MAWCRVLTFLALSLAVSSGTWNPGNEDKCPCVPEHYGYLEDSMREWAEKHPTEPNHSDFGIGCKTHPIDLVFAEFLYKPDHGARLTCDGSTDAPWCRSEWCYINVSTCHLDWDYGAVGPYSYASCGNIRTGTAQYLLNSMASFLGNDSLRVFHVENTLEDGYLGNTVCDVSEDRDDHQRCEGLIPDFWNRALTNLSQVNVSINHGVILKRNTDSPLFDHWIRDAFGQYSRKMQAQTGITREITNFDLCAFATAVGYVDLCLGKFTLTQERQRISYLIPLYTSPVFLISESQCDFLASQENWKKKYFWWLHVFSWEAWLFFVAVVFLFLVLMRMVDSWQESGTRLTCSNCSWRCRTHRTEVTEAPGAAVAAPQVGGAQSTQATSKKKRKSAAEVARAFLDFSLGVFEAFVYKQKAQHNVNPNTTPKHSRSYYMLKLGLNFFILLTTTIYGSNITAKLIAAKEAKVKFDSWAALDVAAADAAKKGAKPITLCVHQIMLEFLEPFWKESSHLKIMPITDYEKFDDRLIDGTCQAALLEEEVWYVFRHRGDLCDFAAEATPMFYMPTGSMVSSRAHRTLESFRFAPSEASCLLDPKQIPRDLCSRASAFTMCNEKEGVPYFTFLSLFLMAITCAVLAIVHQQYKSWAAVPSGHGEDEQRDDRMERGRITQPTSQVADPEPSPSHSLPIPPAAGPAPSTAMVTPPGTVERPSDLELRMSPTASSGSSGPNRTSRSDGRCE